MQMAEYISREAVMSKCDDIWNNADETTQTGVDTINTIDEITDFIESLPIADVQPVNQWISVKDRLPEIGKSILIYYPYWDGDEIQVAKLEYDEMMFDVCGEFNIRVGAVTHWMPLPKPPKDGET